ncbi:MAG TPA: tripartite tricarboxylate transporter substrate-binding protein [Burkholderiaceae bacterium]|nr:tripartite tricarboxylate transporter substrate-binding protein [Burkholderiaceae bacterium]
MSSDRRKLLQTAGLAALSGVVPATARAQKLPAGTIRILVGFPAGGGTDVMARYIADKLRERTGNNVIVENRAGASGVIAIDALKKAPLDGSVIMYGTAATTVALTVTRKSPGFVLEKDMMPLGLTGLTSTVFVVSPTIGVSNLQEYTAWLKRNPGKNTFGTTALGSNTHFFGVLLGKSIGIPVEGVGYKGAAPLLSDLMAGHVAAGCGGLTDFLTHHQAGKVKIIALSASRRLPFAPDLPTVGELGHPALGYEGFYGFYGPPGMPQGLVDAWSQELKAATESPDLKQKLFNTGLDVLTSGPAEFATRQAALVQSFGEMMRKAGYAAE